MKKLKFKKLNLDDAQILSREELKHVLGGDGYGGGGYGSGGCYVVGSTNGQESCWYITGSPVDLCERVYGSNCSWSAGPVSCTTYNCIMN
ncbi:MAG: hypothetical protein JSS98_06655 [Bacteroidetes bacterium]|nr:hypothetical protein [Bacteroidota bacterium]